jgi:Rrf2 family cysteine metabolism transcriptional repressor
MLRLAANYNQGLLAINEVASSEGISEKFMESIIAAIKSKGLVKVKRGAKGGYFLAKPPSEITMYELFDALDADILNDEWNKNPDKTSSDIVLKDYLQELHSNIQKSLKNKTLEDLVNKYESLNSGQMFYI